MSHCGACELATIWPGLDYQLNKCTQMITSLGGNIKSLPLPSNPRWSFLYVEDIGRFSFNKNSGLKFRKFHLPNGTVHSGCTDPTQATARLVAEYKRAVLGTTILSNGKGHFGPTDRNDLTSQRGPPSKLVPNIPVGPNRNGPFHLMYQPKFPEFWVEWKAPIESTLLSFVE